MVTQLSDINGSKLAILRNSIYIVGLFAILYTRNYRLIVGIGIVMLNIQTQT